jgi:hypothetical protein
MRTLLTQIETSLDSRLYYLSLFAALSIPDIAGALDSADGIANRPRYAAWYEKWVRPRFVEALRNAPPNTLPYLTTTSENPLTGDACYRFRCSLLHQGSSQHPASPFDRIIFVEPGANSAAIHYNALKGKNAKPVLSIDLNAFCLEVVSGAKLWLAAVEQSLLFKGNYAKFARYRPEGLPPSIVNLPVVG